MILELFMVLMGVSIIFFPIGKYIEIPILMMLGCLLLFVLGLLLMTGGLQYRDGQSLVVSGNTTTISYAYSNYSGEIISGLLTVHHVIGFFLSITAALTFISILLGLGRLTKNET